MRLRQFHLPAKYRQVIEKAPGTARQYLGQPDLILLDEKTLISVYPVGHGAGPIVMQVSRDGGLTWKEKKGTPDSWKKAIETPTIYKLNFVNGDLKLMLISGCPDWKDNQEGGWLTSLSSDGGASWSEFQKCHPFLENGCMNWSNVAMASLIQVKDPEGNRLDKWLGVYHDNAFRNYKTYLTFDESGNEKWSAPEPYLAAYREIERTYQICEVCLFRSPDGKRLMALGITQSHRHQSVSFYSDDEGLTWSVPRGVHDSLQGERHKAAYDPISGRLLISFREIIIDHNQNGIIEPDDWLAGDWVAWIGTYEDILERKAGLARIVLAEDWTNSNKSGDTGYAGLAVQNDGTFILHSYGHWDREFSENWQNGVETDLCYIIQAKFKLKELGLEL